MRKYLRLFMFVLIIAILFAVIPLTSASATYAQYNYWNSEYDYQWACTWIAWTYAQERGYYFPDDWGHAGSWYSNAAAAGYACNGTPSVDSIACWSSQNTPSWGHVAYVTEVGEDYITFREGGSGWQGNVYGINTRTVYTWSTYAGKSLWPDLGFIHLGDSYQSAPTNVRLDLEKTSFLPDDHVTFYCTGTDVSYYCTTIYDAKGNVVEVIRSYPGEYPTRYYEPGEYTAYCEGFNSVGSKFSNNITFTVRTDVELDVNGWIDNVDSGNVEGFASFDIYINGAIAANDVYDFCQSYAVGTTYEIRDIKVFNGKAFDGFSSNTRSGFISGGRSGTLEANTDVRLTLHTVDSDTFVESHQPKTTSYYNGEIYFFYDIPVTWYDAKVISEHLGGHLVSISNSEENNFIKDIIGNSACWIGATDKDSEGAWKWVNGDAFSYANWGQQQPDNWSGSDEYGENFAQISENENTWNDNAGYTQLPFVCVVSKIITIEEVLQMRDWYFERASEHPELGVILSSVMADDLLPFAPVENGSLPEAAEYCGVSLTLEEKAMLRFFFTVNGSAEGIHFFRNGEEVEPVKRGQYLTVDIPDISDENFGAGNTISVSDGASRTWTIECSVLSYAQKAIARNDDTKLTELMKALFLLTK